MNTQETFQIHIRRFLDNKTSATLLGIMLVFLPYALVGALGESLGAGTYLSNAVIYLAFALAIGIATLVMKKWGWNWRTLGMGQPNNKLRTVFQAVVTTTFGIMAVIIPQIIVLLLVGPEGPASNQSEYNPLSGNLPLLLITLLAAWTYNTFSEEMIFRGFLLNALRRPFPQTTASAAIALAGSSMMFGLAHFAWGWIGMLETTLFGLVMGIAYLRSGRNLWVTIIAHALGNTIKFLLIYSGAV